MMNTEMAQRCLCTIVFTGESMNTKIQKFKHTINQE